MTIIADETETHDDDKIVCKIDGARVHAIQLHIKNNYADEWTIERYKEEFPGEPLLSEVAKTKMNQRKAKAEKVAEESSKMMPSKFGEFHKIFDLGSSKAAKNNRGNPIKVRIIKGLDEAGQAYLPDIDPNYVFDINLTKTVIMGLELNMPIYLWGYHGTGKTTVQQQVAARTGRPFVRVQHSISTEESHIIGQWTVRDGSTNFQLGPLADAMKNGYVYCADEYDTALPSVLTIYQPVLEGQPLVIKEAPPEMRVIRPHPDFRFVATGNTNGGGDETGLYQGTQIQNAANYSRFAVTEEVKYMEPKIEAAVVSAQSNAAIEDAGKLVKYANEVRENFVAGRLGSTISPRELINAAKIGLARGSDWVGGLNLAFANRLSRVDQKTVEEYAQRVFGNE